MWAVDQSFAFSTIGSTGWTNSYGDHSVTCTDGTVSMNASKQTGTITDYPVTKGQPVSFVLSDNTKSLSAVSFTCSQWGTKAQTITLKYSTNRGSSYSTLNPSVTSTNFSISSNSLPTGTNAVQITFSSTSNQVGIVSMSYTLASGTPEPNCSEGPLDAPEVTAVAGDKTVTLSWETDANATGYQLKWNGGDWADASSPVEKSNLTNGTAYTYQVKAIGDGTNYCDSDPTTEASATPNLFHTVTWNTHNGQFTTTLVLDDTKPTFPKVNDADPTSCDNECKTFYGWATSSFYKTGDISAKTIYTSASDMPVVTADNVVYYAVFTDAVATDYSTTYTSNVAIDENVSVVINSTTYDAKKLGKNGGGGSFTISIPSGTTKLYLHAAGWNGKSASLTVSTNVGTISPSTAQSLTANSAISGSETTFTLTTLSNDFFEYSLSNVTSDATITITTTSERGVIWGVNATDGSASEDAYFLTTCCTPLGSINGSVSLSRSETPEEGKLVANWQLAATTGIGTLNLELWKKGETDTKISTDAVTINTEAQSKTYTGLDFCATYYVKLVAAKDNSTYCTDSWTETSGEASTIGYAITLPANGKVMDNQTELGTVTASASRACVGDEVTLDATPTSPYTGGLIIVKKTSDNSDVTSTYFNAGTGKLTMPAFGVTISASFTAPSAPSVSATGDDLTETTLAFGEQEISTTSSSKTFTITGLNLTGDVTWTKGGTNASEFTVTSPESGTIAQATAASGQAFTVTFSPTSAGTKYATLTFSTSNEDKLVIALSGTGVNLYTVTLNVGGGNGLTDSEGWTPSQGVYTQKQASNGASITLPNATLSSGLSTAGWSFAGWKTEAAIGTQTSEMPTFVDATYIPSGDVTLFAVYRVNAGGTAKDVLNNSFTGVTGTSYSDWSAKGGSASDAVYAGNSAGGNNSIQLRSSNNSGIISTVSGGKAKKVTVSWNSNTANERTLDIYGKNTAYSATSDLYSSESATQGTKLGSIVNGTGTELTITGDYAYIGLRSNSGAMYLDAIQITWSTASYEYFSNPSNKVSITYDANGGENAPAAQENITIGSNPTAATIGSMEKEGHTFSKWNTKADGTGVNYDAGGTITNISTDMKLYAIWTINKHTVAVSAVNNGTITATPAGASAIAEGSSNTEVAYGTVVTLAQNNETHYTFGTWTVMAGETPIEVNEGSFTMPDADVTVSANFTENAKRTVRFYKDGTAIQSGDVYVGETPSAPSAVAPECFGESNTFAGWATTPWTGTDNNPAGIITTLPAVVAGEDAISYHAVFCKGSSASNLFEWEGGASATLTEEGNHVTASGLGSDYGDNNSPYLVKLDGTGDYIIIEVASQPEKIELGVKMIGGANTSTITVQESTTKDGPFTDVQALSISGSQNDEVNLETTNDFASTTRAIKLLFTKGSNVGVGPITIMEVPSAATNYMTNCQAELGAIDETVGLTQLTEGDNAGKLQATWTMASTTGLADNGIIIKIYKEGTAEAVHTSDALSKDVESYVWTTAPDYCSEYYASLTPVRVDATYKEGVEQGKSASNCVVGAQYTYSGIYSHVAPKEGETVATNSCSSFSVEFEGTESYTLPTTISVTGVTPYTWENGVLSFDKANVTGNVSITINGVEPPVTTLSATPTALNFGTPAVNESVTAQKFRISGVALSAGDITITSPNAGFTVSPSKLENIPAGNLEASAATEITVTPVTTTAGVFDGSIAISGCGASTTVPLTMEVKEIYTVNWYVNGSSTPARTQSGVSGTALTEIPNNFSSATDCMDKEFMGWATTPIVGSQNNAPEDLITNTAEMTISGNADYYAVFATMVSEGGYEKVTDVSVLTAGDKIVIADGTIAMKAYESGNNFGEAAVTLNTTSDKITALGEGACEFTLGGTSGAWTLFDGAKYVYAAGTATTGKNHMKGKTANEDGDCEWEITISSGSTTVKSKTNTFTPYMRHNSTNSLFSCYNSSSYGNAVTLFRKADAVYSAYVTTCPHITNVALIAGSAEHGSIAFKQGEETITSVRTDGGSAVEVDVVATIDPDYELTGLTLTSEDVTGADKNEALTKITIPAGEEGTLTVTPTFTLIPMYSITFAKGDAAVTGADPAAIDDQYAGTPIILPENNYTWTDHKYDGWKVTYVDANQQVQEVAISDNTFTMPAANVTITAQWIEYVTCAVNAYVNGTLVQTEEVQSEHELALSEFGTPADISGYTFAGWALAPQETDVTSIDKLGASITPEAGVASINIYAVFSRVDNTDPNIGKYVKVTEPKTDWSGQYLIIYETGNVAFDGSLSAPDATGNQIDVTIVNNVVTATTTANKTLDGSSVTIAKTDEGYTIHTSEGKYIGKTAASNGLDANATTKYYHNISMSNSVVKIQATGGYYLMYMAGTGARYRYYNNNQSDIQLYKKAVAPTLYTTRPGAVYAVSYDLGNDGNGNDGAWEEGVSHETINVKGGSTFEITSDVPVLENYKFSGWKVNGEGETVSGTITITGNANIVAQWTPKANSALTYSDGAETDPATSSAGSVLEGTEIELPAVGTEDGQINFSKSGYDFKGWKYNGKIYKAGSTFTMPAESATLVAQWKKQNVEKMKLITSTDQLVNGMKVVIAEAVALSETETSCKTMGAQGNNNRSAVASTVTNGVLSAASGTTEFTLIAVDGNKFAFQTAEGNYLYAASSGSNYLREQITRDANGEWSITIANGEANIVAQGTNTHNIISYNSSSSLFSCYTSVQKAIAIYASMTSVTTTSGNISEVGNVDDEVLIVSEDVTIDQDIAPTTMIVPAGVTVTVSDQNKIDANTLIVEKGGKLDIATTGNVKADDNFVISTTLGAISTNPESGDAVNNGGASSEIINAYKIAASGNVFFEIELTQEDEASYGWYAFSVPFMVDAMSGIYYGNTQLVNEQGYAIMSYDGQKRANGDYGWAKYRGILQPGVLYLITVADTDYKTLRFKKHGNDAFLQSLSIPVSQFNVSGRGQAGVDNGWNGIGNPYMLKSYCTTSTYLQFLDHEANAFKQRLASAVNLVLGSAFFIQYGGNAETIDLTIGEQDGAIALAPTREGSVIENTIFEVKLRNSVTNKEEDNLFLTAREDATNTYEIGRDLAKMSMGTAKCAQIMVPAYGTNLCAADFPLVNNQAVYPLTMTTPTAGTYSLSAAAIDGADLYVTYEGQIVWNLSLGDYEMDLAKGTTTGYGLLLVVQPNQMPTGVENGELLNGENDVQKILLNGQLYILRDGHLYDAVGKEMK